CGCFLRPAAKKVLTGDKECGEPWPLGTLTAFCARIGQPQSDDTGEETMLDLTSAVDKIIAASIRPWVNMKINLVASLASRLCVGIAMLAGLAAPAANAQTQTPFATGVTEPIGGLILSGSTLNPVTGNPYRHLWTTDQGGFGMCRMDPDVDTPGPHT